MIRRDPVRTKSDANSVKRDRKPTRLIYKSRSPDNTRLRKRSRGAFLRGVASAHRNNNPCFSLRLAHHSGCEWISRAHCAVDFSILFSMLFLGIDRKVHLEIHVLVMQILREDTGVDGFSLPLLLVKAASTDDGRTQDIAQWREPTVHQVMHELQEQDPFASPKFLRHSALAYVAARFLVFIGVQRVI